jgi:hypothetical protein
MSSKPISIDACQCRCDGLKIGDVNVNLNGVLDSRITGFGLLGSIEYVGIKHVDVVLGCSLPFSCRHIVNIGNTSGNTSITIDINHGKDNSIIVGNDWSGIDNVQSPIIITSPPTPMTQCVGRLTIDDHQGQRPLTSLNVLPSVITIDIVDIMNHLEITLPQELCTVDIIGSPLDDIITIGGISAPTSIHGFDGGDNITAGDALVMTPSHFNLYQLSLAGDNGADYFSIYTKGAIKSTIKIDDNSNDNEIIIYGCITCSDYWFTTRNDSDVGVVRVVAGDSSEQVEYTPTIGAITLYASNNDNQLIFADMIARIATIHGGAGNDRFSSPFAQTPSPSVNSFHSIHY